MNHQQCLERLVNKKRAIEREIRERRQVCSKLRESASARSEAARIDLPLVASVALLIVLAFIYCCRPGGEWAKSSFSLFTAIAVVGITAIVGGRFGSECAVGGSLFGLGVFACQTLSAFYPPFAWMMWMIILSVLVVSSWRGLQSLSDVIDSSQQKRAIAQELLAEEAKLDALMFERNRLERRKQELEDRIRGSNETAERKRAERDRRHQSKQQRKARRVREAREQVLTSWAAQNGPMREQLHLFRNLPAVTDLSAFDSLVFARLSPEYLNPLRLLPVYPDEFSGLTEKSRLRVELGQIFAKTTSVLNGRYPVEEFDEDLDWVLGGTPVVAEVLEAEPSASCYALTPPCHGVLTEYPSAQLQASSHTLPLHFAELMLAVAVHEGAVQQYQAIAKRDCVLVDTIIPSEDFHRLSSQILIDWRNPRAAASEIEKLLTHVESLLPHEFHQERDELDQHAEARHRREAIESLRLHFLALESQLTDEVAADEVDKFIRGLPDSITLGELQIRIDRQKIVLDNLAARNAVRRYYSEHAEMLEKYFPRDVFEAELESIEVELPRSTYGTEMGQLHDRVGVFVTAVHSRYSQELKEDRFRRQTMEESRQYQQGLNDVREKYRSVLQRTRSESDTDEQIEARLEQMLARWRAENPPPSPPVESAQ